jgi:hypothetical protein
MRRASKLMTVGIAVLGGGVLLWMVWIDLANTWWLITVFHQSFSLNLYHRKIYMEPWGMNQELFAILPLGTTDQYLVVWGRRLMLSYFAGFGVGRNFRHRWVVALPLWAVAVLIAGAALLGRVAYRWLARSGARKRGFEVVRGEDPSV